MPKSFARPRRSIFSRIMLGLLTAIVLLGGYGVLDYNYLSRPKPTGDALTDKLNLAQWRVGRQFRGGRLPEPGRVRVSIEQLDSWRPQFDHDPRYWQLRYWATSIRRDGSMHRPYEELETARTTGAADATTLIMLSAHVKSGKSARSDSDYKKLLDEAVEADSQCAPAYYLLGAYYLEHDNKAAALEYYKKGNAATNCSPSFYYPVSIAYQAEREREPAPDYLNMEALIMTDEMLHRAAMACMFARKKLEPQDYLEHRELFEEIHHFACRLGATEVSGDTTCIASSGIIGWLIMQAKSVAESYPGADRASINTLQGVYSRIDQQITEQLGENSALAEAQEYTNTPPFILKIDILDIAGRDLARRMIEAERKDRIRADKRLIPLFEALSTFDYMHPAISPEMQHILDTIPDRFPEEDADQAPVANEPSSADPAPDGSLDMPQVPTTRR